MTEGSRVVPRSPGRQSSLVSPGHCVSPAAPQTLWCGVLITNSSAPLMPFHIGSVVLCSLLLAKHSKHNHRRLQISCLVTWLGSPLVVYGTAIKCYQMHFDGFSFIDAGAICVAFDKLDCHKIVLNAAIFSSSELGFSFRQHRIGRLTFSVYKGHALYATGTC